MPDSEQTNTLPEISLEQLAPDLQQATQRAGWTHLMPVQARSMPYMLADRDVMVQSRTGSGKTGAFVLPTLARLDPSRATCQALVLAPTRELANQVANEAITLSGDSGINTVPVYGGVSYGPQRDAFRKGAHLVVGTPGRILDHLMNGTLDLSDLQVLVMDEADRMLSVGFYPDMKAVQRHMPDRRVQTAMFSATFPPHVMRLASEFMVDPAVLSLSSDNVHVTDVTHTAYHVPGIDKDRSLVRLIETENPNNAIIFCNQKVKVNYVTVVLQRFGYDADQLSGDMQQNARERVLKRVRAGELRFLVATDVAARGIDIPDLSHVFQYDVPQDHEAYIHRAGRTGRAGASGSAIILHDILESVRVSRIVKQYGIDMQELPLPDDDSVAKIVSQRVTVRLEAMLRQRGIPYRDQLDAFEPMVELLTSDADGIRALAFLLEAFYQRMLHEGVLLDEEAKQVPKVPKVTDALMATIAVDLNDRLKVQDQVQNERISRFEPLVEELAMSGVEFYLLSMLLADHHNSMKQPTINESSSSKNKRPQRKRSNRPRSGSDRRRNNKPRGRSAKK